MKRLRRALYLLAASLAATAVVLVARVLIATGVFTTVHHQFAGSCIALDGAVHDLVVDQKDGVVFASQENGIAVAHLDHLEKGFESVSGTPKNFRPIGLGLYAPRAGSALLTVIDRAKGGEPAVLGFDVRTDNGRVILTERSRIAGGLLVDPKGVVPVGPDQFYATNGSTSRTSLGRFLERFALVPRGNIVFFDGSVFRVVVEDLSGATGIEASEDGTHVYAGSRLGRTLYAFERNPFDGALKEVKDLPLSVAIEAVRSDREGNLWLVGHPDSVELWHGPQSAHPSEVFRISLKAGAPDRVDLVYADSGDNLSGARAVATTDGTLLIGSPSAAKTMLCRPGR